MKAKLYRRLILVFSVLLFVGAACALPTANRQETPEETGNVAQTAAVKTIDALMTDIANKSITSTLDASAPATETPASDTPAAPTLMPSSTPQPTSTAVFLPSFTPTNPVPCDQAVFVSDVSVPDGSVLQPNAQFSKTWRIRNTGSCTWTSNYAVVFDSGSSMSSPASQNLDLPVIPGQTIDITLVLRAPTEPGQYRGHFKLRNASGVIFGTGAGNQTFYVDIKVVTPSASTGGYDFTANYCVAEWSGNGKAITCLGKEGDVDGFVLYKAKPVLENSYKDDEPALITFPPKVNDGVIRGKYPSYTVRPDDRFKTIIGCDYNAKGCSVRFQLDYQIDNGTIQTFAAWNENYDNNVTVVDLDLNPLAGKNVRFILTVLANGSPDNDRAQWLLPRIVSKPPTPTPTMTPTITLTPTPTETEEAYPAP
jgi:hypothetical protein